MLYRWDFIASTDRERSVLTEHIFENFWNILKIIMKTKIALWCQMFCSDRTFDFDVTKLSHSRTVLKNLIFENKFSSKLYDSVLRENEASNLKR